MNKTTIEWTDWTWNPLTGCRSTPVQCAVADHCYARRTAKRLAGRVGYPPSPYEFEPTFHPERLEEPYKLKKPSKIFVCSMGELFGHWVWKQWQDEILKVVQENPQHIFQFLTKFPPAPAKFRFPPNAWLGVTVNEKFDVGRIQRLNEIKYVHSFHNWGNLLTFVSAEPLLGPLYNAPLHDVSWLILGAQTNPRRQPKDDWVKALLADADHYGIPIFMKDNLDYQPRRREWPDA